MNYLVASYEVSTFLQVGTQQAAGNYTLTEIKPPSAWKLADRRLTPLERENFLTGLKSAAFSNGVNKTSIPGLFVCGNAFKVYDLVDSVSRDSIIAGRMAAEYLRSY